MSRKPKFKPEITRIKLNPEQAVLSCTCYMSGHKLTLPFSIHYAAASPFYETCGHSGKERFHENSNCSGFFGGWEEFGTSNAPWTFSGGVS